MVVSTEQPSDSAGASRHACANTAQNCWTVPATAVIVLPPPSPKTLTWAWRTWSRAVARTLRAEPMLRQVILLDANACCMVPVKTLPTHALCTFENRRRPVKIEVSTTESNHAPRVAIVASNHQFVTLWLLAQTVLHCVCLNPRRCDQVRSVCLLGLRPACPAFGASVGARVLAAVRDGAHPSAPGL